MTSETTADTETTTPPESDEPNVKRATEQAAKYRIRAKNAEASLSVARDALLRNVLGAGVRTKHGTLKPADVDDFFALTGTTAEDYFTEAGTLNEEHLTETMLNLRETKPHLFPPADVLTVPRQGLGNKEWTPKRTFSSAFKPQRH
ncbi:hypothetical protein [Brevibacterium samyangense]|uniref:Uncharacterized protein n=1 Tax=Brevibacterium samyangense TaxID=366888 RepID=A0ABP5F824_9MICO